MFLSDHGEELGEHGGWLHDQSVYEELVRSPLLIRFPGGAFGGRRISELVSLVDLLPTVLDFIGKPELVWQLERDNEPHLVALQPLDDSVVPDEACQIVEGADRIVGRVTSSRMSPTLGRSICLGIVASHLKAPGTTVTVVLRDRRRIQARVMEHHAHFDPKGERLHG